MKLQNAEVSVLAISGGNYRKHSHYFMDIVFFFAIGMLLYTTWYVSGSCRIHSSIIYCMTWIQFIKLVGLVSKWPRWKPNKRLFPDNNRAVDYWIYSAFIGLQWPMGISCSDISIIKCTLMLLCSVWSITVSIFYFLNQLRWLCGVNIRCIKANNIKWLSKSHILYVIKT